MNDYDVVMIVLLVVFSSPRPPLRSLLRSSTDTTLIIGVLIGSVSVVKSVPPRPEFLIIDANDSWCSSWSVWWLPLYAMPRGRPTE